MATLIDYNQCQLCNSYIYKKYFNNHFRECTQKNIEKYNAIMNKYKTTKIINKEDSKKSELDNINKKEESIKKEEIESIKKEEKTISKENKDVDKKDDIIPLYIYETDDIDNASFC